MRLTVRRVAALAAAALCAAPLAAVNAAPPGCYTAVEHSDGWSVLSPVFPSGPGAITGWAIAPDQRTQYATNGSVVLRSDDAACSWRPVLTGNIVEVGTTDSLNWVVTVDTTGFGVQTSVDGGATWTAAGTGLPPVATPVHVVFAGTHGYALLRIAGTPVFYTSTDGTTWAPAAPDQRLDGFAVGAKETEVYGWGATGLLMSTDAGQTFTAVGAVTGTVTAVAPPLVFTTDGMWSPSGGSYVRTRISDHPDSAATDGKYVVTSGADGTWLHQPEVRSVGPVGGDEHLRGVAVREGAIWGWTHASVFYGLITPKLGIFIPPPKVPPPPIGVITLRPGPGVVLPTKPELRPANLDLRLHAGTSKTVRYTLDLPPTPTPVDVDFLIDTTRSIQPVIEALREQLTQIVNRLAAMRLDAQFGVGAFREYPVTKYTVPSEKNYAYARIRPIGPIDSDLEDALYALKTGGGTIDGRTSALAAAYQAATGAGQVVLPQDGDPGNEIPKGLGAGWRKGALHVLLMVTDTEPRKAEAGYPGPSVQVVGEALAAKHVYGAGIVVGTPSNGAPGPRDVMEEIANRSRAVAAGDGVDCDEDGNIDLSPGQPLVCDLVGNGLTGAIVQLLRGVRDLADIGMDVQGDPRTAQPVSQTKYQAIDMHQYHRAFFDVRYSCPTVGVTAVGLDGWVRKDAVARATATVTCYTDPPPLPPPPPRIPRLVQLVAAAAAPPPPPPPQVPNVNVNPNPNPNPNPQYGFAAQEQTEPQLAYAADSVEDEAAVSRQSAGSGPAAPMLLAASLVAATACAVRLRTCRSTAPREIR